LLKDLLRTANRTVSIASIQQKIADYYKIRTSDLFSSTRERDIARPRQLAMFLSKKHTLSSLVEIGKKFGGRDHTTVMHAIKQINKLLSNDNELLNDLIAIERALVS
jgi:chromosomal replication initiator protein